MGISGVTTWFIGLLTYLRNPRDSPSSIQLFRAQGSEFTVQSACLRTFTRSVRVGISVHDLLSKLLKSGFVGNLIGDIRKHYGGC